jgi:methyl-accepting chemotaxis protein
LTIIAAMAALVLLVSIGHRVIIVRYEQVDDGIFLQYDIINRINDLVLAYITYRNVGGSDELQAYIDIRATVDADLTQLESTAMGDQERSAFDGMRSTVRAIETTTDDGVKAYQAGDLAGGAQAYTDAASKLVFVRDDAAALILRQLDRAQQLRSQVTQAEQVGLGAGLVVLLSVIGACIVVATAFARSLVNPMTALSDVATRVGKGDLEVKVEPYLLARKDELGILARSFEAMLTSLHDTIQSMEKANHASVEATAHLEEQNRTLEQLNRVFVQREQRVNELQEELERAKRTASAPGATG